MPKTFTPPQPIEDEVGRTAAITGSDIVAAWFAVLLLVATVLTSVFFR